LEHPLDDENVSNTDKELAKRIGRRISAVRRERGLTSEKLAYEFGISKGYLSRLENGKKLPSLSKLNLIAQALDVDIKEMF
jgi:transcriptional regulator with XRE-family HTH domain